MSLVRYNAHQRCEECGQLCVWCERYGCETGYSWEGDYDDYDDDHCLTIYGAEPGQRYGS